MARDEHNKAAEHHENAAKAHRSAAEHHGKATTPRARSTRAVLNSTRRLQTSIAIRLIRRVSSRNNETRKARVIPGPFSFRTYGDIFLSK